MTVSKGTASLAVVSDIELLRALEELIARDRFVEADLLAHLGEVDSRELYLEEGCSSMFVYCVEVLHFSESEAYHRIHAARAVRRYPLVLDRVREGEIHLTGVNLLAPHLTQENCTELLDLARHRSKREIAEILADRAPRPEAPAIVRRLPATLNAASFSKGSLPAAAEPHPSEWPGERHVSSPAPPASGASAAPAPRSPSPEPLGEERYKIQFTASRGVRDKLREAQSLLRHQIPNGELAEVFDRALTLLIADAKRKRFAQTARTSPRGRTVREAAVRDQPVSRHIPAHIRRAVVARDGDGCRFVGRNGRRCGSRDFLEFHHEQPWARSARHSVAGISLRCRAHNQHAAVQDFGAEHMARCRGRARPSASSGGSCTGRQVRDARRPTASGGSCTGRRSRRAAPEAVVR
jgi:hypothetical protein